MAQIFISHVSENGEEAAAIARGLESAGYTAWLYERDSLPGIRYLDQVAEAIEESEALLVIISPEALGSDQVTGEIDVAYEGRKRLIPVLLRIEHEQWQKRRRDWRQALATAASIPIPASGPASIVSRLAAGLAKMGIRPASPQREAHPEEQAPSSAPATWEVTRVDGPPSDRPAAQPAVAPAAAVLPATKVNPIDGAEMVLIPAGPFLMGDDDRENNKRRTVTLDASYVYKNVVTVRQYEGYCKATGIAMPDPPDFDPGWKNKDHPIVNVSWFDAMRYCEWAGVSLPTEQQWEKAARGTDGRQYPWGNTFDTSKLWCSKKQFGDAGGTTAVGRYTDSPYGLSDMAGNVWQWCADDYDGTGTCRVVRGGSWFGYDPENFRCAYRNVLHPVNWTYYWGFRCVARPNSN